MKHKLIRGLALSLGVCTLPGVAAAQYTVGDPGAGLSAGSYIPLPSPAPQQPVPGVAAANLPGGTVGYQIPGTVGSGLAPAPMPAPSITPNPFAGMTPSSMPSPSPSSLVLGRNNTYNTDPVPAPQPEIQNSAPMSSGSEYCATGSCVESCGPAMQSLSPWIFGANAMIWDRVDSDSTALTFDANDPTYPLLCTRLVDMPATGGFELFGGRYFGCGRYAITGSYWGAFSERQYEDVVAAPGVILTSALPFTVDSPYGGSTRGIEMTSQWVGDWFDGAQMHRVLRDQDFQNAEVNFISFALGGGARQPYGADCKPGLFGSHHNSSCGNSPTGACAPWYGAQCSKLRLNLFGGFRWFQYADFLEYGASEADAVFDYSADDFFYQNKVTNNLFGGQLGALGTWCTGRYVNLFGGTSFGVYNNSMKLSSYAGTANEIATVLSSNTFNGQPFSFTASDNDIALLGEGTVGAGVRITRGWTANIGYRLIGVSGVATSTGQIPRDFSNLNGNWRLHNEHSVILQALTLGAAYNF